MTLLFSVFLIFELKEFPLFTQQRGLTLEKHRFKIFKIKTIRSTHLNEIRKSRRGTFLLQNNGIDFTPVAAWLRKTGFDELPQVFNILKGEMSFVGPRPLMLDDLEIMKKEYPEYYFKRGEINSKPGITGLWQLFGERTSGIVDLKTYELYYDKHQTFGLFCKILFYTLWLKYFTKNCCESSNFISGRRFNVQPRNLVNQSASGNSLLIPASIINLITKNYKPVAPE
jgi:lipopolysaccharide/colanic/teichoic acid biosynthesis glycosyltransferase